MRTFTFILALFFPLLIVGCADNPPSFQSSNNLSLNDASAAVIVEEKAPVSIDEGKKGEVFYLCKSRTGQATLSFAGKSFKGILRSSGIKGSNPIELKFKATNEKLSSPGPSCTNPGTVVLFEAEPNGLGIAATINVSGGFANTYSANVFYPGQRDALDLDCSLSSDGEFSAF